MKLQEGPAFGALIIGCGLAYLIYTKTGNWALSGAAGIAAAVVDYIFLIWIGRFRRK